MGVIKVVSGWTLGAGGVVTYEGWGYPKVVSGWTLGAGGVVT